MPALLITDKTSSTGPYFVKKASTWSSSISMGIKCKVILVLWVRICSVCNPTILVVMMLPVSDLDSSGSSKMSHIAFDHLTNSLTPMLRLFSISSIPSLLTPTNFQVFTSDVSRETVLLVIASKAKGMFWSSFSTINTFHVHSSLGRRGVSAIYAERWTLADCSSCLVDSTILVGFPCQHTKKVSTKIQKTNV